MGINTYIIPDAMPVGDGFAEWRVQFDFRRVCKAFLFIDV